MPIELKFLIRYLGTLYVLAMSMLASSKFLFYTQIFFYLPLAEFFEGPQPALKQAEIQISLPKRIERKFERC